MEGKAGGPFDPSIAELYASLMGHIYHQDAVPWFRFDLKLNAESPNVNRGVGIQISGHDATPEVTDALYAHVSEIVPGAEFTKINLEDGTVVFSFINFRDEGGTPYGLPDDEFISKIKGAIESFDGPDVLDAADTLNEGRLLTNESYMEKIVSRGSSDLLDWSGSRREAFEALVQSWQTQGSEVQ